MKQESWINRYIRWFHVFENTFLCFLLTALILLSFVQISGRMFFNKGFSSADQIIYQLLLWLALTGAAIATRENEHITIDVVSRFVSQNLRKRIQVVTSGFSVVVCGILTYSSVRFLIDEMEAETSLFDNVPVWPFEIIMPVAFGIITLRFAFQMINSMKIARKPENRK